MTNALLQRTFLVFSALIGLMTVIGITVLQQHINPNVVIRDRAESLISAA